MLCPCIIGPRSAAGGARAEPTEGHCDVPMVFRIAKGRYGEAGLAGLHAGAGHPCSRRHGTGDRTVRIYVAGAASAEEAPGPGPATLNR